MSPIRIEFTSVQLFICHQYEQSTMQGPKAGLSGIPMAENELLLNAKPKSDGLQPNNNGLQTSCWIVGLGTDLPSSDLLATGRQLLRLSNLSSNEIYDIFISLSASVYLLMLILIDSYRVSLLSLSLSPVSSQLSLSRSPGEHLYLPQIASTDFVLCRRFSAGPFVKTPSDPSTFLRPHRVSSCKKVKNIN